MVIEEIRGGTTIFNQAQWQMIRLHELMVVVNNCWISFTGNIEGLPAYQMMFDVLSAYYMEIEPNFHKSETLLVEKKLKQLEETINTKSFWSYKSTRSYSSSKTTKVLNYENYFLVRKELREFQMMILRYANNHGIGNPTKSDPTSAVTN